MPRKTKQNDITSPELLAAVTPEEEFRYIVYKHSNTCKEKNQTTKELHGRYADGGLNYGA